MRDLKSHQATILDATNQPVPIGVGSVIRIVVMDDPREEDNAHHRYEIYLRRHGLWEPLKGLTFQKGPYNPMPNAKQPVGTNQPNGCTIESLLAICQDRLGSYQTGPFACEQNKLALDHIHAAMTALHARTLDRFNRGVLGLQEK